MKLLLFCVAALAILSKAESKKGECPENINEILHTLGRQIMLTKLDMEESKRATYASGVRQIRQVSRGTQAYHHDTWQGNSVLAMHAHANYDRIMGLGEFDAILNGVEFRTRHNDYRLMMPSKTSKSYNLLQEIPFPPVPPAVNRQRTVAAQISEMRQWFKAFKDQDYSRRDYRKHFKPVLCYIEGSWIHSGEAIEEAFKSERHHLDAETWYDMQEMIRYTAMSGTKDKKENYAYLPTTITRMDGPTPVVVQWNYRILCHPLKNDLPLNRLRPVIDQAHKMGYGKTMATAYRNRATRFELNAFDTDTFKDGPIVDQLLDKLMGEIPGKDNYPGKLTDSLFGRTARVYNGVKKGMTALNSAYYHRSFSDTTKDASGHTFRFRGFQDQNVFMAETTNPKVPAIQVNATCKGEGKNRRCAQLKSRWSYAFPLEIVYMTPLSKWNPHKVVYKGHEDSKRGLTVTANGRNGNPSLSKAYNGVNSKYYALTPFEFYTQKQSLAIDPADTGVKKGGMAILKRNGRQIVVNAVSGHRATIRDIPGVGVTRQRYPIIPIVYDGNPIMKEVKAIRDQLKFP